MSNTDVADVVVIGGGLGGLSTAVRATQLGLRVTVLERGHEELYLCNSRFSGGILHIAQHNVLEPAEQLERVILDATLGEADPALARTLAVDARRAVGWLAEAGTRFIKVGQIVWQQHVLAPPRPITPGMDWKGRGPDVTLRVLEAALTKGGGSLMRGVSASGLMESNGSVVGVEATSCDGASLQFPARAVVIADGGFQSNLQMIGEHITAAPAKLKQRGAATGVGDGLRMAKALGAAVSPLNAFYGHMLSRDSFTNDKVWPYPQLDELGTAGIVVDGGGERFVDEGMGGVYVANMIARLPDPLSSWAVFDEAIWNGPGKDARIPANPHLVRGGGTVLQAKTLTDLAAQMQVPVERLMLTVEQYNDALAQGKSEQLSPRRTSTRIAAQPVRSGPFYAVPLCAGITYTMGGICISTDAKVVRSGGESIGGLYAVGATTGGLEGGSGAGYVGGLIKAATFGIRAAEDIARSMR